MKALIFTVHLLLVLSCADSTITNVGDKQFHHFNSNQCDTVYYNLEKVEKSDEEWRNELSEQSFYVTRQAGTERAFTGEYWDLYEDGVYHCICCRLPLFSSEAKYKSGTGWPSFFAPIRTDHVGELEDKSHGWVRTEVTCNRCDAHLGHVFNDGPKPSGLRYCLNSAALLFKPQKPQ